MSSIGQGLLEGMRFAQGVIDTRDAPDIRAEETRRFDVGAHQRQQAIDQNQQQFDTLQPLRDAQARHTNVVADATQQQMEEEKQKQAEAEIANMADHGVYMIKNGHQLGSDYYNALINLPGFADHTGLHGATGAQPNKDGSVTFLTKDAQGKDIPLETISKEKVLRTLFTTAVDYKAPIATGMQREYERQQQHANDRTMHAQDWEDLKSRVYSIDAPPGRSTGGLDTGIVVSPAMARQAAPTAPAMPAPAQTTPVPAAAPTGLDDFGTALQQGQQATSDKRLSTWKQGVFGPGQFLIAARPDPAVVAQASPDQRQKFLAEAVPMMDQRLQAIRAQVGQGGLNEQQLMALRTEHDKLLADKQAYINGVAPVTSTPSTAQPTQPVQPAPLETMPGLQSQLIRTDGRLNLPDNTFENNRQYALLGAATGQQGVAQQGFMAEEDARQYQAGKTGKAGKTPLQYSTELFPEKERGTPQFFAFEQSLPSGADDKAALDTFTGVKHAAPHYAGDPNQAGLIQTEVISSRSGLPQSLTPSLYANANNISQQYGISVRDVITDLSRVLSARVAKSRQSPSSLLAGAAKDYQDHLAQLVQQQQAQTAQQ